VRMEPVKPFSVDVKVPMVAIVVFLSRIRAAAIAASMAVEQTGDDRTAPDKAAMKWRAASRRFVSGRGGGRSLPG